MVPTHPVSRVIGSERVRITTVDAFVKDRDITRVDVMKMNIQGAELILFRGARESLERGRFADPTNTIPPWSQQSRGTPPKPVCATD